MSVPVRGSVSIASVQIWLAQQSEGVKQAALDAELEAAKDFLGDEEVRVASRLTDDEADAQLAEEIRMMKARDEREWERLLGSLPAAEREKMSEIERRFGV